MSLVLFIPHPCSQKRSPTPAGVPPTAAVVPAIRRGAVGQVDSLPSVAIARPTARRRTGPFSVLPHPIPLPESGDTHVFPATFPAPPRPAFGRGGWGVRACPASYTAPPRPAFGRGGWG